MTWLTDYRKSLKLPEAEEVICLIFYRPLGFLLVKSLYSTDITPNQISLASIAAGIMAGVFIGTANPGLLIAGGIIYIIYNILDCSDGQLARMKGIYNPVGRIIDGVADYIATMAVYFGMLAGFALKSDQRMFWTVLLVFSAASSIVHSMMVDYYRTRYLDYKKGFVKNFKDEVEEFRREYESLKDKKGKWLEKVILRIYFRYASLQGALANRGREKKEMSVSPEEYCRKNKTILGFWLILGPSTHVTVISLAAIFNRFDIFIILKLALFNLLMLVLLIIQKKIDLSLHYPDSRKP